MRPALADAHWSGAPAPRSGSDGANRPGVMAITEAAKLARIVEVARAVWSG
jgi:hypothetical protein